MRPTNRNDGPREKIATDVANYLAMGKRITEVAPDVSAEADLTITEKSGIARDRKVADDRRRLKEYHERGEHLGIKWMPANERFRLSCSAKNMGHFPTLDEAINFKVKV